MDAGSGDLWAWLWLVAGATGVVAEMLVTGTMFLLPLSLAALVAAAVMFAGGGLVAGWVTFVVTGVVAVVALRPLGRRLSPTRDAPVGATRLVGRTATVTGVDGTGGRMEPMVKVDGELWRADTPDGAGLRVGDTVEILDVVGTRLVVRPVDRSGTGSVDGPGDGADMTLEVDR